MKNERVRQDLDPDTTLEVSLDDVELVDPIVESTNQDLDANTTLKFVLADTFRDVGTPRVGAHERWCEAALGVWGSAVESTHARGGILVAIVAAVVSTVVSMVAGAGVEGRVRAELATAAQRSCPTADVTASEGPSPASPLTLTLPTVEVHTR